MTNDYLLIISFWFEATGTIISYHINRFFKKICDAFVSTGICALFSLVMIFVSRRISHWVQFIFTLSFTCLWGYAVVVKSFVGIFTAPGKTSSVGTSDTILLALWINLFLSLDLSTMNFVIILRECHNRNRDTRDDIGSDDDDPDR